METVTKNELTNNDRIAILVVPKINAFSPLSEESLASLLLVSDTGDGIPQLIDVDGDDICQVGFTWASIAAHTWTDGADVAIHEIADGVFVESGTGHDCFVLANRIEEVLANWDTDEYGSYEGLLVAFGVDPDIVDAPADYDGPVRVWIRYHYFSGQCNAPSDGWVVDDDDFSRSPRIFPAQSAAENWIAEMEDSARGCYPLQHGEYAAPDYIIAAAC